MTKFHILYMNDLGLGQNTEHNL